jgi:hypothetical protein
MMVAVPVLPLQAMPQCEPRHGLTRVVPERSARAQMTHTVDKTLSMQCEHQAYGPEPEESCGTKRAAAEKRDGRQRDLQSSPNYVTSVVVSAPSVREMKRLEDKTGSSTRGLRARAARRLSLRCINRHLYLFHIICPLYNVARLQSIPSSFYLQRDSLVLWLLLNGGGALA